MTHLPKRLVAALTHPSNRHQALAAAVAAVAAEAGN